MKQNPPRGKFEVSERYSVLNGIFASDSLVFGGSADQRKQRVHTCTTEIIIVKLRLVP